MNDDYPRGHKDPSPEEVAAQVGVILTDSATTNEREARMFLDMWAARQLPHGISPSGPINVEFEANGTRRAWFTLARSGELFMLVDVTLHFLPEQCANCRNYTLIVSDGCRYCTGCHRGEPRRA